MSMGPTLQSFTAQQFFHIPTEPVSESKASHSLPEFHGIMETSFFTTLVRLSRLAIFAAFIVASINATCSDAGLDSFTIISGITENSNSPLLDFRSEATRNKKVLLKWKVAQSIPYTYQVEKSRDGENFTPVQTDGIQAGSDNEFTWTDHYPKLTNCYRLRMTDGEGTTTYSKTLVVTTFPSGDAMMVGVTPDITRNDMQVNVQLRESAIVSLNITKASGELVLEQKEKALEGMSNYTIKGSSTLLPGEYFLKVVINGTDRMLVRLIKS
jgi:hypothetical protein